MSLLKRVGRIAWLVGRWILAFIGLLAAIFGGYQVWMHTRPQPDEVETVLFEGVTYTREVRTVPRPLVIHVVRVDLDAEGIGFFVTPGEPTGGREMKARTTSGFLEEFDLQVAVNGDYFEPWEYFPPWNYYPKRGDPVDVKGFASSDGDIYSTGEADRPTLYISEDNQANFDSPIGDIDNAISGNFLLLNRGEIQDQESVHPYLTTPHPRTALALDQNNETLIIIVVDGRQPNYSEGVTMSELAEIVQEFGGYTAVNLDGGGSSTLAIDGQASETMILNSPIDQYLPGRERPVANHLGVYAQPVSR
jgi:hypothetical protein